MRKFWYKPRNRGIVYSIGFVLVFGSYVVGSPPTSNTNVPESTVSKVYSSLNRSTSETTPVTNQPTHLTTAKLEKKLGLASSTKVLDSVSHPNFGSDSGDHLSFDVSEMNASKEVKDKIVKRLSGEKKDYPYEVEESERNQSPTYAPQKNAPRLVSTTGGYTPNSSKSTANQSPPASEGLTLNSKKSSSSPSIDTKSILAAMNSNGEGQVEYNPEVQNPVPGWLQPLYPFVHIYEFKKGVGGSTLYPSFGLDQESDYPDIRNVVFSPPDWQLDWKFTDENLDTAINRHLLPLGTNGTFTIQIQNGFVSDQTGPDFLVVENPFCSMNQNGKSTILKDTHSTMDPPTGAVCYPEPARVEVGDTPNGKFYSFPCDGVSKTASWGCAGIVPNVYQPGGDLKNSGGDLFDLSKLKDLPKGFRVRYIRIVDLNNSSGFEGTKGFDLDAFVPFNIQSEK